jgi:hypothetical protein
MKIACSSSFWFSDTFSFIIVVDFEKKKNVLIFLFLVKLC